MSPFDVHYNRAPLAGTVAYGASPARRVYRGGAVRGLEATRSNSGPRVRRGEDVWRSYLEQAKAAGWTLGAS
jgi:hypothetical protein